MLENTQRYPREEVRLGVFPRNSLYTTAGKVSFHNFAHIFTHWVGLSSTSMFTFVRLEGEGRVFLLVLRISGREGVRSGIARLIFSQGLMPSAVRYVFLGG